MDSDRPSSYLKSDENGPTCLKSKIRDADQSTALLDQLGQPCQEKREPVGSLSISSITRRVGFQVMFIDEGKTLEGESKAVNSPPSVAFEGFVRGDSDYSIRVIQKIILDELGFVEAPKPDIVICTEDQVSLRKVLENYSSDTIRILFNCELGSVDFNFFDYVIGWEEIDHLPRYARMHPALRVEGSPFMPFNDRLFFEEDFASRKFCSFIASNGMAHPFRDAFFRSLSAQRRVDSWGRHLNNAGRVPRSSDSESWELDKVALESNYKFSFAIENGIYPGYTTEKVFSSFKAGTIPIYWGNPLIAEDLNPNRIFSLHDFESIESAIESLLALDGDPSRLIEMASQKVMSEEQEARVNQSREEIRALLIHAAETARSGRVLRPQGTTATVREALILRALRREEHFAQLKDTVASLLWYHGVRRMVNRLFALLTRWKRGLNS